MEQIRSVRQRRPGATLAEATMAIAIVSLALVAAGQLLVSARAQRRVRQHRVAAEQEASNTIERVLARPWDDVTAEKLTADQDLMWRVHDVVPNGQVEIGIVDEMEPPIAKRITVEVRTEPMSGASAVLARLVAWKYAQPE